MPATPESHHSGDGSSTYNQTTPIGTSVANTPPDPDSSIVKVTRGHSCVLCQQRKVRCDIKKPCSNCVKVGAECRVIPPQPPRRRKKRIPERDLVDRLRKYEALLSQNNIAFESLGPDIKIADPGSVEDGDELDPDFTRQRARASPGVDSDVISSAGENLHKPRTFKWFPYQKVFRPRPDPIPDSSEEEDVGSTINHAYDQMFGDTGGFPFAVEGRSESVTDLHPSALETIQLWQTYLANVDPLLKLTHTPTLQVKIIEASTNFTKVSKSLEALMFAIYLMAITSLGEDEVQQRFTASRSTLLARYQHGTQQALFNAGFMRMPDLTILQAYLLYCIGVRQYTDPRTLFCLTGLGVRLCQRLGLQRDGAEFGFSPFEVEERRRLWWNFAGFDRRLGEMCGSTITAISTGGNCKLPLNINDAELNTHAKDPPPPHMDKATEMIFALTRLEFAKAPGSDKMKAQLSPANPTAVTNLADHRLSGYFDQFAHYMEETYLRFCKPEIPIHYMTLLMTRANICKMKISSGFFRVAIMAPSPLPAAESEALFIEAIQMIEYDSMVQAHESLKGFLWYTKMHFPFPAYVCLLSELRQRTSGDLCERAWETIFEHAERRKMLTMTHTPLHLAFSALFVKAWDAREAAEAANGRTLVPPRLITLMRQIDARRPKKSKDETLLPTPSPKAPMTSVAFAPNASSSSAPATSAVPNTAGYHPANMYGNMQPTDINRQFSTAFPEVNFGGEMDWNYLIQEYGFMPHQGQGMNTFAMAPVLQDSSHAGSWH